MDVSSIAAPMARLAHPALFLQKSWIDGHPTEGECTMPVISPRDGQIVGEMPILSESQIEHSITVAAHAFKTWKSSSALERSVILRRWSDLVMTHQRDLALILSTEQGKPLVEAQGEIGSTAAYLAWFAEEARRVYGSVIPANESNRRLTVIRQPLGVVAAITPWNFPSSMIARKVGPALAAGCTVVLKPSELTPYSALALAFLASEAGVPDGVFNVVTGDAELIGQILTDSTVVRKLSFTGSTAVGKMLAARCATTVKRVSLELGGNAPFIVFDDADLDAAVEAAIVSKFRNTGQTCVCANRFLVQDAIYDDFAARLSRAARALRYGDALRDSTVTQGPLINRNAVRKVEAHIADAVDGGASVLTGGKAEDDSLYVQPTVLRDVSPEALLCREETFGPVAGLVRFKTEAEAIALANDSSAGLAAYFFTRDFSRVQRVSEALEYGMVGLNSGLVSTEVGPFGGVKESGYGREGSYCGIDEYLDTKLIFATI